MNTGTWINPCGYTLRPTGKWRNGMGRLLGLGALWGWYHKRREYEFTLDPVAPLTFAHPDNYFIQPDRHGFTDLGTIPEILEPVMPRNQYEPDYILHDSACDHHGLYFSSTLTGPFVFCPISSKAAHVLLGATVRADGASEIQAWAIETAVKRLGPRWTVNPPA